MEASPSPPALSPFPTSPLRSRRAPTDPASGTFAGGPHPRPPPAFRRGLHPEAIHSVVWVDDTVYVTKTPLTHPAPAMLAAAGYAAVQCAPPRALNATGTAWPPTSVWASATTSDSIRLSASSILA